MNDKETLSNFLFISFMYEGSTVINELGLSLGRQKPIETRKTKRENRYGQIIYDTSVKHFVYCALDSGYFSEKIKQFNDEELIIDSVKLQFQCWNIGLCQWYSIIFYLADHNLKSAQNLLNQFEKCNETKNNKLIFDYVTENFESINATFQQNASEKKDFIKLTNILSLAYIIQNYTLSQILYNKKQVATSFNEQVFNKLFKRNEFVLKNLLSKSYKDYFDTFEKQKALRNSEIMVSVYKKILFN